MSDEETTNPKAPFTEVPDEVEKVLEPGDPEYQDYNNDKLSLGNDYSLKDKEKEGKIRLNIRSPERMSEDKTPTKLVHDLDKINKIKDEEEKALRQARYIDNRKEVRENKFYGLLDKKDKKEYESKLGHRDYLMKKLEDEGKLSKGTYNAYTSQRIDENIEKNRYIQKAQENTGYKEREDAENQVIEKMSGSAGLTINDMLIQKQDKKEFLKHQKGDFTPRGKTAEEVKEYWANKNKPGDKKEEYKGKKIIMVTGDRKYPINKHMDIENDLKGEKPSLIIHGGAAAKEPMRLFIKNTGPC